MKNMNLNPGGIVGALDCGVAVGVIAFMALGIDHPRRPAKLAILGVIGGAVAGNVLWGLIFKRPNK